MKRIEKERKELARVAKERLEGKVVWINPSHPHTAGLAKVKIWGVALTTHNHICFSAAVVGGDGYYDGLYIDDIVGVNLYGEES